MTDSLTKQELVADVYKILDDVLDCDCVSWRSVAEKQEAGSRKQQSSRHSRCCWSFRRE